MAFAYKAGGQTIYYMQNGKLRVCKGILKDSEKGKTTGEYDHNENYTLTLSVPGAKNITLKFKSFCTEKDNDILRIFDGKDTFASLMGTWSGTKSPGTITSTDSFLTLHFKSDKSVSCTGWEAEISVQIITPPVPKLSLAATAKCKDNSFIVNSDVAINCDSFLTANMSFSGPVNPSITSVTAVNCSNKKATQFKVNLSGTLNINGSYTYKFITRFKDFCDSVYVFTSTLNFSVLDCPLKVILKADDTLICKGSCTYLRATVSGGNPSKYIYTWTPAMSGAGPQKVCPTAKTQYILKVTDGISIPSSDTVTVNVADPPVAMADTEVCYTSGNFNLRATPSGGTWKGPGIVNAATGEFKPVGQWGYIKVWYQVGSCADTVVVLVYNPWQLENVFCQNTGAKPLWWYWPTGGTWSGPRVNTAGIFNPDTAAGTYKLTYNWKGCITTKNVVITNFKAQRYDTACESTTSTFLNITPKGIYPNWFNGLVNSYTGEYNPKVTGPGTKTITYTAGGCNDTTYLTVLPIFAGANDTFCPSAGVKTLKTFRPSLGYAWTKGKGIVNPSSNLYNPSFYFGLGKLKVTDTLQINAGKCTDRKFVYLMPVRVTRTDTLKLCYEDTGYWLLPKNVATDPPGGKWSGTGLVNAYKFKASVAGYGLHQVFYTHFGCEDTFNIFVRPKPVVQNDTLVCINSGNFNCYTPETGGKFSGAGIVNATNGTFSPAVAKKGLHTITYTSKYGCIAQFKITVDTFPPLWFVNTATDYCFKDSAFLLSTNIAGGTFSGPGVMGNYFNPKNAGSGTHTLTYSYATGSCKTSIQLNVTVSDTLTVDISPKNSKICPGEILKLTASGKGGDKFSYLYNWSHNQTGASTYVIPKTLTTYTVTLTDGCSDKATANSVIDIYPKPYFNVTTSEPRCFGVNGWAKVTMKDNDAYAFVWNSNTANNKDSFSALAGGKYRLSAVNKVTGCSNDTTIEIPGYKNITAGFLVNYPLGFNCLTNLDNKLRIINSSGGATTGTWYWGDGSSEPFNPAANPTHSYSGDVLKYKIKLVVFNAGGCKDSLETQICFSDTIILYIPNAFKPTGDGINKVFKPVVVGARDYRMLIYNRWGQIVFETHDVNQGWDGTYHGKPCMEGVYAYQITYNGRRQAKRQSNGSILLLN